MTINNQNERICESLRQIADTLEDNTCRNRQIMDLFRGVVAKFSHADIERISEKTYSNDFLEWQIIEDFAEVQTMYLQKTALDSITQPIEIGQIPTNLRFSEMINFLFQFGMIENNVLFGFESANVLISKEFEVIMEFSLNLVKADSRSFYRVEKCLLWEIYYVQENPYLKKKRSDASFKVMETLQVAQIPTRFTFMELVNFCVFVGIVE